MPIYLKAYGGSMCHQGWRLSCGWLHMMHFSQIMLGWKGVFRLKIFVSFVGLRPKQRSMPYVKELWKSVGHSLISNSFFQKPLLEWLETNLLIETSYIRGTAGPYFLSQPTICCGFAVTCFFLREILMPMIYLIVAWKTWQRIIRIACLWRQQLEPKFLKWW